MSYRLHIDIPLQMTEEEALTVSTSIVNYLTNTAIIEKAKISQINYRLGHDEDRQKSNYFMKNENGHVNNKKCKIDIDEILSKTIHNET